MLEVLVLEHTVLMLIVPLDLVLYGMIANPAELHVVPIWLKFSWLDMLECLPDDFRESAWDTHYRMEYQVEWCLVRRSGHLVQ